MTCPSCQSDNRESARFCGDCGNALPAPVACAACGVRNVGGRRFCDWCGTSLWLDSGNDGGARMRVTSAVSDHKAFAAIRRLDAACETGDWTEFRALLADDAIFEDRRKQNLRRYSADGFTVAWRELRQLGKDVESFIETIPADDVVLTRRCIFGKSGGADLNGEFLWLVELSDAGRIVYGASFDAHDAAAALVEAKSRADARLAGTTDSGNGGDAGGSADTGKVDGNADAGKPAQGTSSSPPDPPQPS